MAELDDGGPAFPDPARGQPWLHEAPPQGMSLRDWFAGQALPGLIVGIAHIRQKDDCVAMAYEAADAMLRKRKRKK